MRADPGPAVLLVDKPRGPTSHDVVAVARRATGIRRIGHTGTLDPFASGLLLLCVGRATRLASLFHLLPKRYTAEVRLGVETETDDRTGPPRAESTAWQALRRRDLEAALRERTGPQDQVPPAYSAKKVDGRRAHRLARAGQTPALAPTRVVVHALDLVEWDPPRVVVDAWVSTGTFVRALARDLGRDLGCRAHLAELRRTAIGGFEVTAACPPAGLADPGGARLPPLEALRWLPLRRLDEGERDAVRHGRPVDAGTIEAPAEQGFPHAPAEDAPVALVAPDRLVAVGRRDGGRLRPVIVLDAA
ncbi:MAG: tRNA pseudouridine(55) synthase TruB [Gemmatimonadota bacterium]|nr:tRNA pseudouridine(55) synthase TruB [Gemmatimonadota bacterium]